MTKEEEAIEYIRKRIKVCNENADICDDNNFDEEATYLREESYMLETVLSMLKQKDKEIKKKDKIIDEMIGSFIDLGFGFKYCNNDDRCINDCDKCIKQYFERKASKMLQKGRKNNGTKIKYRNIKYHRRRKQWKIKKLN